MLGMLSQPPSWRQWRVGRSTMDENNTVGSEQPGGSEAIEKLGSRIDELRAASYSMSEKLSESLKRLEAGLSEFSAVSSQLKSFQAEQHKQDIIKDVTESVGNIFSRHPKAEEVAALFGKQVSKELDAKLSTLAELELQLLAKSNSALEAAEQAKKQFSTLQEWAKEHDKRTMALSDAVAEARGNSSSGKHQLESAASKIASAVGEMKAIEHALGSKLSATTAEVKVSVSESLATKLAELEAKLFKKETENSEKALSSIAQNTERLETSQNKQELMVNALGNLSNNLKGTDAMVREQVVARQAENYAAVRATLLKIAENQNKLNEVLADSLTSLLDSTESNNNTLGEVKLHLMEVKARLDLEKPENIESKMAAKPAKKH